jgi:hypothetical protein
MKLLLLISVVREIFRFRFVLSFVNVIVIVEIIPFYGTG